MDAQMGSFLSVYVYPVLYAVLIVAVGVWISRIANKLSLRAARNAKVGEVLARFLGQGARYAVLAVAVMSALREVGVDVMGMLALFSAAALAVGLALQGSLAHFASGVMLMIFRPFDIDDVISAGGHTGKVEEVGLFATTLVTPDNHSIVIPNGAVSGGSIVNYTRRGFTRGSVSVGVAYGSDVDQITGILTKAAESVDSVMGDPGVSVGFVELGGSSIDFTVFYHCDASAAVSIPTNGAVRKAVYDALNEAEIDIPYQTVVVQQG